MKVLQKEVKTIYTITFTAFELGEMIDMYRLDENYSQIVYKGAFDFAEGKQLTKENLVAFIENLGFIGTGKTYDFIANHFGFDGWENTGHYNEAKKEYRIVVYDAGNRM